MIVMDSEILSLILGSIGGGLGYAIGQIVQFFLGRKAQKAALAKDEQNAYAEMARQDNETILDLFARVRKLERAIYATKDCKFAYQCPTLRIIDMDRKICHYPRDSDATLNSDKETAETSDDDPLILQSHE